MDSSAADTPRRRGVMTAAAVDAAEKIVLYLYTALQIKYMITSNRYLACHEIS